MTYLTWTKAYAYYTRRTFSYRCQQLLQFMKCWFWLWL